MVRTKPTTFHSSTVAGLLPASPSTQAFLSPSVLGVVSCFGRSASLPLDPSIDVVGVNGITEHRQKLYE